MESEPVENSRESAGHENNRNDAHQSSVITERAVTQESLQSPHKSSDSVQPSVSSPDKIKSPPTSPDKVIPPTSPDKVIPPTSPDKAKETKTKIDVLLKAAGDAPIMKKKKWAVEANKPMAYLTEFIRKYIKCEPSESLFIYVNQTFVPSPDQTLSN